MNPLDFIAEKNEFQATFTNITTAPMVCGVQDGVAAPTITQVGNDVTMSCATDSATIKYSTDGGTTFSTYENAITIVADTTFTAYAKKVDMVDSEVVTFSATFIGTVATPTATCESNVVTMSCATDGATIKYSVDGENFANYESPITITETTTYTIKAVKEGMIDSASTTYTATYVVPAFFAIPTAAQMLTIEGAMMYGALDNNIAQGNTTNPFCFVDFAWEPTNRRVGFMIVTDQSYSYDDSSKFSITVDGVADTLTWYDRGAGAVTGASTYNLPEEWEGKYVRTFYANRTNETDGNHTVVITNTDGFNSGECTVNLITIA